MRKLVFFVLLWPGLATAGLDEERAAYKRNDFKIASKEYKKLAKQGNASAQFSLGWMYEFGQGVPQDFKLAIAWYLKAAEHGIAGAQVNLGVMYYQGRGVPQDYSQAYHWLNLAAANGGKDAIKYRDVLAAKMTASQIEEAERLARIWSAKHIKDPNIPETPP